MMVSAQDTVEEVSQEPEKLNISIDVKEVSSCERHFKVTVPPEDIERYYTLEFDELEDSAYVPGFRQGKAPRKLVEKRFRKEIADRVKSNLVMDCLTQVNESTEMTPIGEPQFNFGAIVLPETGPLVFEFDLEVRPEFDLPNWKGLKLERPVREFGKKDLDRAVERVLADYGKLIPTTEAAQPGDFVVTKLTFTHEGAVVSKAEEETIRIRPTLSFQDGSIKDFDQLMTGVVAGDVRTSKAILSQDAPNRDLRGQEVEATFEILEVKKLELPELNKEFFERIGGYEDEGEFRDAILDMLKRQLEHEQRQRARQQITKALTVSATWELPPKLLEGQAQRELTRAVMELQRSGFSEDQIRAELNYLRQNSRLVVGQALKEHFILEKIAEVENIEETQADIDTEVALIAAQSNSTPRRVRAQIEKQGKEDILRNQVIERKVLDLILSKAEFVDVPLEMDTDDEEAIDCAAGGEEIPEATQDDLKAARKDATIERMIDPNARVQG